MAISVGAASALGQNGRCIPGNLWHSWANLTWIMLDVSVPFWDLHWELQFIQPACQANKVFCLDVVCSHRRPFLFLLSPPVCPNFMTFFLVQFSINFGSVNLIRKFCTWARPLHYFYTDGLNQSATSPLRDPGTDHQSFFSTLRCWVVHSLFVQSQSLSPG